MNKLLLFSGILAVPFSAQAEDWETREILSEFHAESAAVGNFNGDQHLDIAYGPFWYAGPAFATQHRYAEGAAFDGTTGYSESFFTFAFDANHDGLDDLLVYGFPGKGARLYLNPGKGVALWDGTIVAEEVSNESPTFVDLIPGGFPEIVCSAKTAYGFYEAGEDATKPWAWHPITPEKAAGGRFEHGLGVGDINQDGRLDMIQKQFWFEQPETPGDLWKKHGWSPVPTPGGAQILVHDFDGDGDSDLVSSIVAHGYGLAWFEQTEPGKFVRHDLMGEHSTDSPYGICFSQAHALTLADIDGDGRQDFVTGKRYFAHQGKDPGGLDEPVLYWFRNTATETGIDFVPHLVNRDSGVGVDVVAVDLNADHQVDIITANKKGLIIHLQTPGAKYASTPPWKVPSGRPQDDYKTGLTAKEAVANMEVPEGFSVDLITSEPDLTQPVAMCFDARGRIWVIEGLTYPAKAPGGEGKDNILIFEDSDGDGSFETRKVFAKGLNLASGIEVGFGGVFVGAAPEFLFYPDKNGDDIPDREPEVLLDGWGHEDTHETLNSFTWGPDGWLYGCHGVFTHSKVGKPGTPENDRQKLNAGLWRWHPTEKKFEVWAHGTSNPWGADFDKYGEWFISACVIPHFYHLSEGGRYQRQGGQHFNPWTFGDIKTIADHAHYTGKLSDHAFWGANSITRPAAPADTSALGGGHAHSGLAIYSADEFPVEYRGEAFFNNLHGHRLVREHLERSGSGYLARHRPDFLLTNNHEFIGVGVMQGTDGALYFSDWADVQTCHHRDVAAWDRSNGRIYRVRYGDAKTTARKLPDRSDVELVTALGDPNSVLARQAQRLLQERAATQTLALAEVDKALAEFETRVRTDVPLRLRAFWTRSVTGLLRDGHLQAALADPSEHLRGWAVKLADPTAEMILKWEAMAKEDPSLVVRRQLASRLQGLPLENRWNIAEGLIAHPQSQNDANIPTLCWYGIEPLFEKESQRAFSLGAKTTWPMLKEFFSRRSIVTPTGREEIMTSLTNAKDSASYVAEANQLLLSLAQLPPVERPSNWETAKVKGRSFKSSEAIANVLRRMGVRFGDSEYFGHWRRVANHPQASIPNRIEAVELLSIGKDPELGALARALLTLPPLRKAAISALRQHPGADTANALVSQLASFDLGDRNEAINLLASRPEMALPLLEAVDTGTLEASLISPVLLDQFERFHHERIDALILANWTRGSGNIDLAELSAQIVEWKKKLNPEILAKADASRGRKIFDMTCGTCHKLFGQGVALGPDLTGSNRVDLAYVLENVLAPSAVVGKDYLLHIFLLKDGATVSGMVKSETPEFVNVSLPGGSVIDLARAEIASRQEMAQSLMPPGLFEALPLEQVADLVKYLSSPAQVPLPETPPAPPKAP